MLETVREFGLGQLAAGREDRALRARHADYFEALAERAAPRFLAAEQLVWLTRMDDELDNVRTVLAWLLDHDQHARGQVLAGSLWYFWSIHSRVTEGREWLRRLLAGPAGAAVPARTRGRALLALGIIMGKQYDVAACDAAYTEGLALARRASDRWTTAMVLVRWAWTLERLETSSTASHRQVHGHGH